MLVTKNVISIVEHCAEHQNGALLRIVSAERNNVFSTHNGYFSPQRIKAGDSSPNKLERAGLWKQSNPENALLGTSAAGPA